MGGQRTNGQPNERKALPVFVTKVDVVQGIVEAVVSVFGVIDLGNDIVHPGAYAKTINERAGKIRVLDQHQTDSIMRAIGKPISLREIGREELPSEVLSRYPEATGGLLTATQYLLDTPEGAGAFKRIASGAVNEYSIGYDALDVDYSRVKQADGKEITVRNLRTIRLWEYSPVLWGMNEATATVGVKAAAPGEEKAQTLGVMLQARIIYTMGYFADDMFAAEQITVDEHRAINEATYAALGTLMSMLPEDLTARIYQSPYHEWDAAEGADAAKAGRVLSARSARRIQEAMTSLMELLSEAGLMEDQSADAPTDDPDNDGKSANRTEVAPDASTHLKDVERELIETQNLLGVWT